MINVLLGLTAKYFEYKGILNIISLKLTQAHKWVDLEFPVRFSTQASGWPTENPLISRKYWLFYVTL